MLEWLIIIPRPYIRGRHFNKFLFKNFLYQHCFCSIKCQDFWSLGRPCYALLWSNKSKGDRVELRADPAIQHRSICRLSSLDNRNNKWVTGTAPIQEIFLALYPVRSSRTSPGRKAAAVGVLNGSESFLEARVSVCAYGVVLFSGNWLQPSIPIVPLHLRKVEGGAGNEDVDRV